MKKKHLLIFLTCYIAYTSIYIARLNLSTASPALKAAGLLTTAQLGILGSAFSVVYAVGRLLNGILSDRTPPALMLSAGLAATGLSNILIGFFPPFTGILLLWCANGFAQSMLWSSILRVVAALYWPEKAKKKGALMVTSVAAGNIAGILAALYITDRFGLRWAFILPGALTAVLAGIVLAIVRRAPAEHTASAARGNLFQLLKSPEMRTAVFPAMAHGLLRDNVTLWMTAFLVDRYDIDLKASGGYVLLIPVLGFLGRMAYPACYRLCGEREHLLSQYGFVLCAAASAALCAPGLPPVVPMVCLSLVYACASLINTSFLSSYPIRFAASGNVASVSGLMDFVTYLGAGRGSLVYGFFISRWGYQPMFVSWAALSVLSVFLLRRLMRLETAAV